MNKINIKLLWIAVGISLVGTIIFYQYLNGLEKAEEKTKYVNVVVAKENINSNTKITETMLEEKKEAVDESININIKKEDIIGKYVKETILKGEIIRKERLVNESEKNLAMKIPENKRAISVSVNEYAAVGDMIQPGNYVDVYMNLEDKTVETAAGKIYYQNQTKLILQNIQVIAVSQKQVSDETQRAKTPATYSITLAAFPYEAEKMIYAENYGTIKLALRGINDIAIESVAGVDEGTMRNN